MKLAPSDTVDGPAPWQAGVEALRRAGAHRADPVRWRYLEALADRVAGQPDAVRRLLEGKLQAAVAEYERRHGAAPPSAPTLPSSRARHGPTPLAGLVTYLEAARPAAPAASPFEEPADPGELASARRFRRAWSGRLAQDRLQQAVERAPVQAGPLNSHMLVVQSLALMGELSTEYLRHFLSHVETLQWLERAGEAARAAPAKAARPAGKRAARSPKKPG